MQVTRYQMHNVLGCYSKKLSRVRGRESVAGGPPKKSAEEWALSSETSRVAAMDKISRQVLDKVMDVVALSSSGRTARHPTKASGVGAEDAGESVPMEFAYRVADSIDVRNNTRTVVGDPEE
jgi:hypothetical protein